METMSASNTPEEEKKPLINLKVLSQGKADVVFRLKRTSPLKKLMLAYCDSQSVAPGTFEFLFDGTRINAEKTPHDLGLEDGDEIDAMLHQDGGGRK